MKDAGEWRRAIHDAIVRGQKRGARSQMLTGGASLTFSSRHLRGYKLAVLDVDNRAKTILDAFQGLLFKKGKRRHPAAIIPNDNQI